MTREHFDSSVLKQTKDGQQILSSYLDDGEKLVVRDGDSDILGNGMSETQPSMTSDDANVNTVPGETETTHQGEAVQGEDLEPQTPTTTVTDDKKTDGKDETVTDDKKPGDTSTGTTSDKNQTNETQTPTTVEQQSDATTTSSTKKKSTSK